jgi:hypothetical protein
MNLNDYGYNENQAFVTVNAQKGTEYEKFGTVSIDNPLTLESFYNNAGKEVTVNVLALPKKNKDDRGGGVKETRVVCTYNVTSTDSSKICKIASGFTSMEVDGVEITAVTSYYTFTTTGEHTVKYTLKDNTSIGESAFTSCNNLISVVIPDSVISIGDCAFYSCNNLTSVTFGSGVTEIGYCAFGNCGSLTSVVIPDSVTTIGERAFRYCNSLTSVTIDNGVTTIVKEAFYSCKNLTSVIIPDSVTSIGNSAFYNTPWYASYSADTANQYGNIIYINNVAYQATSTGITSCEFKEGTTYIAGCTFSGNTSLTSVDIPDSVTSIGNYAFWNCSGLTSVTIGSGVTTIGEAIFYGCSGLTSVTIPDSVTTITQNTFAYCTGLTSVTIGSGVTTIGSSVFQSCSNLTNFKYNGTVAQWKAITRSDFWHSGVPKTTQVTCTDGTCGLDDK